MFLTPLSLSVSVLHLLQGNVFQDAVFNQTVTITEKEDGLDGETYVKAFLPVVDPLLHTCSVHCVLVVFFSLM